MLAFLAASVAALQIEPLENAHSQGDVRITWINEVDDAPRFATFSAFLHHPTFRSDFAILNNHRPADGGENVTLPVVPAQDGYTLPVTDAGNINTEFAVSPPFSIGPELFSTSSIASSASSALPSGSAPATASGSGTTLPVPQRRRSASQSPRLLALRGRRLQAGARLGAGRIRLPRVALRTSTALRRLRWRRGRWALRLWGWDLGWVIGAY